MNLPSPTVKRTRLALLLGFLGLLVLPLISFSAAIKLQSTPSQATAVGLGFGLAGLLTSLAAMVLGAMAIASARRESAPFGLAIVGIVMGLLGLGSSAFSSFVSLIAGLGGGHGRPFRREGLAQIAGTARNDGWLTPREPLAGDDALADAWRRDAQLEHASVAAFSRLSLELLAMGAPAALVSATHRAALDEVDHATRLFSLAHAIDGRALGPQPFAAAVGPLGPVDWARWARDCIIDGCIDEAASAKIAEAAARSAEAPAVRDTMTVLARDEAQHAALSWSLVEWAAGVRPEVVREALEAMLAEAEPEVSGAVRCDADGRAVEGAWAAARAEARAALRPSMAALCEGLRLQRAA